MRGMTVLLILGQLNMFRINVKVRASSGRQEIEKLDDGSYKVFLKKAPEDGKANLELEKFLKKEFGATAKIIKGFTSKNKVVEIENETN